MQKLTGVWTNFLRSHSFELSWLLWPGAEDKALRGRNLSAVFRTLNRQVGKPPKRLPSCAHTWRVENQCDKSTLQMFQGHQLVRERRPKNPFHSPLKELLTKQSNCLSIFPGQVQRPKKMKPQIGANHRNWVQIIGDYRKSPTLVYTRSRTPLKTVSQHARQIRKLC
jgi:hypothetical protein